MQGKYAGFARTEKGGQQKKRDIALFRKKRYVALFEFHFKVHEQADGWMSRSASPLITRISGIEVPLFLLDIGL